MSRSVSVTKLEPGKLGNKLYPDVPGIEDTLLLLENKHGFRAEGVELKPAFRWVERRKEVILPKHAYRFAVELHYVIPHLNLHIIHTRSNYYEDDGRGLKEAGSYERAYFMPWAHTTPGPIKDEAFGRWLKDE